MIGSIKKRTVVGGALGEDVHVAGVVKFLKLAAEGGWNTEYLGPAVSIQNFIQALKKYNAELGAVSYRLTPETGKSLLIQLKEAIEKEGLTTRFVFGGTPVVVEEAEKLGLFEKCFSGSESDESTLSFLKGELLTKTEQKAFSQTFVDRLTWSHPFPLIRHHFGLPDVDSTIDGIKKISDSMILDVISLGIDQDAQENFFHPERQDQRSSGAGGVPVRTPQEYKLLHDASRRGNFPLMRVYSGTDDQLKLAEIYVKSLNNAWCATSIYWFNQLDKRGPLNLKESIEIHQELMRWHSDRNIPIEVNEPHQWGMREAPDIIYATTSYLSAYNAKKMGVRDYIAQYMFNCPAGMSDKMDLAKMLACIELSESLSDANFKIYRQTRTGLLSYPVDPAAARGHLASSVYLQMALKPHIIHVVGASEAHHATSAEELIESVSIARRVIQNALRGIPDMTYDPSIQKRKNELLSEVKLTLNAIRLLSNNDDKDPLSDPGTLTRAVERGVLDAPHLQGNSIAQGKIMTQTINGRCLAIDADNLKPITEMERLKTLGFSPSDLKSSR